MSKSTKRAARMTPEEKTNILFYHQQFEYLLHDMFINKEWTERNGRQKMLRVLAYCLYYKSITADHLVSTGITPASERSTEKIFLNRLAKKGYLRKEAVDIPGFRCTMYTITAAGAKHCTKQLDTLLEKDKRKGFDYHITSECLSYFSTRVKSYKQTVNYAHFIGIRSVNAYLLSYMDTPSFRYQIEVGTNKQGEHFSFDARISGNIERTHYSLQSDALLTIPYGKHTLSYYIEQDMNTQRCGTIALKMKNYLDSIYRNNESRAYEHTLLFSLFTRPLKTAYKIGNDKNSINRSTYMYGKIICYIIYCFMDEDTDFWDVPMIDVYEDILDYCQSAPVAREFYANVAGYLKKMLDKDPDMAAGDFIDAIRDEERKRTHISDGLVKRHRIAYEKRRLAIFETAATLDTTLYDRAALSGFSICTTHVGWHNLTMPYLFPLYREEERIRLMLSFYGYLDNTKVDCTYYLTSHTLEKQHYVLKNFFKFSNGLHLYIENISDDICGRLRVKHYMDEIAWSEGRGLLLCLVSPGDLDTAKQLFMQTKYAQFLHKGEKDMPLKVYFMTYEGFERGRDLFDFTKDGTFHLRPYH